MREARLILPDAFWSDHTKLEERICTAFGGYTKTTGFGVWHDPTGGRHGEDVTIYDIAMEETAVNNTKLATIVLWLFEVTDEQAIYVRYPGGNVIIMDRPLDAPAPSPT